MKHSPTAPPAAPAAVDLKRHLLLRVSLFALAVGVVATVVVLYQTRERIRDHIARSGLTVERLVAGEAVDSAQLDTTLVVRETSRLPAAHPSGH